MNFLLVACGAFFGSILRYCLSLILNKHVVGTWLANISGSILLGVLFKIQLVHGLSDGWWLFLGIGFCGSYTTFSTFGNELLELLLEKRYRMGLSYMAASLLITLSTVFLILR